MQLGRKLTLLILAIGMMIQGPIASVAIEPIISDLDSTELALENDEDLYFDEDFDYEFDDLDDFDDFDDETDSDDSDEFENNEPDEEQEEIDIDADDEDDFDQPEEDELEEEVEDLCSEPLPSPENMDDIPEMLFADDALEYVPVPEECVGISLRSSTVGSAGSGLVQFVLEPVGSLPSGVTQANLMNVQTVTHPLFANATTTAESGHINGAFGRDAIFLGQSGNRFRVMIAGFEGYVNRQGAEHTITVNGRSVRVRANAVYVPFSNYPNNTGSSNVRSVSHYVNRNGELWRNLTTNVTNTNFQTFLAGAAPSWMAQNRRYYSYDGVYFYTNPRNIRADGRGAVNASNPHFNYFQYLSFRSESTVTASQLNNFLTNQSLHGINTSNSVMRNQGNAFINAQNRYGTNALLMYAKAMLESAGGTSNIARNNNNLFGQGAVDAAPGANAWHFATPAASVNNLADGWLSRGYLWPGDWRYEGPHVGHKGSGVNVRYATDPYWGEKIAGWAFRIDRSRSSSTRDRNREQIAIRRNTSTVSVENAAGTRLYTANPRGARYFPFLVTGTSGNRLRILTDPAIVSGVANRTSRYNRNNAVGFVANTNVWLTGASRPRATGSTTNHQITTLRLPGVILRKTAFREGPGSSYARIRNVSANTNIRITGRSGSWYRVVISGQTGWVRRADVSQIHQYAVVTTNNAHVRAGRGTNHRSLTRVPRGQRVTVRRRTGSWARITANGRTGWIRTRDIATSNAMRPGRTRSNNVSVRSRPTSGARVVRRLPRNAQLMVVQRTTNGWSQVRIRHNRGTLKGWVRTSQIQTRDQSRRMTRNGTLRSGPGTNFRSLRVIPRNTRVTIRSRVGSWYHVHANINGRRVTGWQHQDNIRRLTLP